MMSSKLPPELLPSPEHHFPFPPSPQLPTMILKDFLRTFDAQLAGGQTIPYSQSWQVQFDPNRRRAEQDQILIGVGTWVTANQGMEHVGVCRNKRDLTQRFGGTRDPATTTDLVLDPPDELITH